MYSVIQTTLKSIAFLVEPLAVGTNLGLFYFFIMLLSGRLLPSRGGIFPGLQLLGLDARSIRRSWSSFRYGKWDLSLLLNRWQFYLESQNLWTPYIYGGYRPVSVDTTAFFRPKLKGHKGKHYKSQVGKALKAVIFGLIVRVGQTGDERIPVIRDIVRSSPDDVSYKPLLKRLLSRVHEDLLPDEMAIFDAGFHLKDLKTATVYQYVLRLARNFTARRNVLPEYKGKGRKPAYGEVVRPLKRTYKGKTIDATPPDRLERWEYDGMSFKAEIWENLVMNNQKAADDTFGFDVYAIYDPRYKTPWLLACPILLKSQNIWQLYHARWPIEKVPLSAKEMIGANRQFVSAPESVQRLPELALFAGSILSYLAASAKPIPTGFWDRKPKATPGRLRRMLTSIIFPNSFELPERIRKKESKTGHLKKGIKAHRRTKTQKAA